jgi:hypothetical protein
VVDGNRRYETADVCMFLRMVQDYEILDFDIQKGVAWVTQQTWQTQTGD